MKRIDTALLIASLLATAVLAVPISATAQVSVGISVAVGPPVLPDYPQPYPPNDNLIWMPGYWAYDSDDYYWVPGTWVLAPAVGLLWTPGYWGWREDAYWWYPGYWDTRVGYYGGVNYGYGYPGVGYAGGYWRGNTFYRDRTLPNDNHSVRASYNGGSGGIATRATVSEEAFARGRHTQASAEQRQHQHLAMDNPAQRFKQNRGRPVIAGTPLPGKFGGSSVVSANPTQDAMVNSPVVRNLVSNQQVAHNPAANNQVTHSPAHNGSASHSQARLAQNHAAHNQGAHIPTPRNPTPERGPPVQHEQQHARQPPPHRNAGGHPPR
jgi:hypothetical protein